MKTIAIVAQKGGVGKTTTAATLAAMLAENGERVLCIDMNEQGDLSDSLAALEDQAGTFELLTGEPIASTISETNLERVEIIKGGQELATLEGQIKTQGKDRALILSKALKDVKNIYKFCIIDCPGSFNTALMNALGAADSVVIPAQAGYYSLKGIERLVQNIKYVRENINPALQIGGILLTRYNGRRNLSRDTVEVLQGAEKAIGARLFNTRIRENSKVAEAPGQKATVLQHAPHSSGAEDYRAFYKEYMQILSRKEGE